MLTVEYCKEGEVVSDFDVVSFVQNIIQDLKQGVDKEIKVSTSDVIHQIRLKVAQGGIRYDDIQFKYKDEILIVDKDGRMPHYPQGFADIDMDICDGIMNANVKTYEEDRKEILLKMQLLNIECIDIVAETFTSCNQLVNRLKAIRQLVPECGLKMAKEWLEENGLV